MKAFDALTPRITEIVRAVALEFDLQPEELFPPEATRNATLVRGRRVVLYVYRKKYARSYPEIARAFGIDHSTVMRHCRSVEQQLEGGDSEFAALVERVMNQRRYLVESEASTEFNTEYGRAAGAVIVERDVRQSILDVLGPAGREMFEAVERYQRDAQAALVALCTTNDESDARVALETLRLAAGELAAYGPAVRRSAARALAMAPGPRLYIFDGEPRVDQCCNMADVIPGRRCPVHAPLNPSFDEPIQEGPSAAGFGPDIGKQSRVEAFWPPGTTPKKKID